MANSEGGDFNKFIVIKREYIDSPEGNKIADRLCEIARANRIITTRKTDIPQYLVINQDELYADEVIKIMKKHGHWGYKAEKCSCYKLGGSLNSGMKCSNCGREL